MSRVWRFRSVVIQGTRERRLHARAGAGPAVTQEQVQVATLLRAPECVRERREASLSPTIPHEARAGRWTNTTQNTQTTYQYKQTAGDASVRRTGWKLL